MVKVQETSSFNRNENGNYKWWLIKDLRGDPIPLQDRPQSG